MLLLFSMLPLHRPSVNIWFLTRRHDSLRKKTNQIWILREFIVILHTYR